MNKLVIPIQALKCIESWLRTAIGYDPLMFEEEFTEITNRLESGEESELYLTYKDNLILTGNFHEDALAIGKNLVIPIYPISSSTFTINQKELKAIWDKHIILATEQDNDVYFGLLILSAIYYKHTATKGFFGFEPSSVLELPSSANKRKEMLELYILFNDKTKTNRKTIEVKFNNDSVLLRNQDNWFTDMMNIYFDKYLHLNEIEQAKRELANYDPNYTETKGRKADLVYNTLLIRQRIVYLYDLRIL